MATRVCVLRLLQRFVCQESPARRVHRIKGLNVREGSAVRTRRPIDRHRPRFTVVARDEPAADPSVPGCGAATGARLHALGERSHPPRVGAAAGGSERADDGAGTAGQGDPTEA